MPVGPTLSEGSQPLSFLTILAIAVGLAMDAFAVAVAVGTRLHPLTFRHYFRLSFHFGLFQALMPILGWFLGTRVERFIGGFDHWIAFALLIWIGGKMLYDASKQGDQFDVKVTDPTRKWSLVLLSLATSIDALAVGFSIALLQVSIVLPSVIIGLVALAFTAVGLSCGHRLGVVIGRRAGFLGGLVLIAIALRIVIAHLT